MENNTDKLLIIEQNKYTPYKSLVAVYRYVDGMKKKAFEGLVTSVTSRGLIINPVGEEGGECFDVLAGSFVPFNLFCDKFEIQTIKSKSQ